MFGLGDPKLPIDDEQREWIDESFVRLAALLGAERMLQATVVLPTPDHFPDSYDRSEEALQRIFARVATRLGFEPADIDLTLHASEYHATAQMTPYYSGKGSTAAGLYYHDPAGRPEISVDENQLKDPLSLVATLAHEISHIILLRPGLIGRDEPNMEQLTDLLTVFLGFGVFTANSVFRFSQYNDVGRQGWSAQRHGYLTEQQLGYSLARFAYERRENKPSWAGFLSKNPASYMKRSSAWLAAHKAARFLSNGRHLAGETAGS